MGLLAMTSATLVDGLFIGNFVGVRALAAVNLLIPIMSILFGVGIMLATGGSVRGGKYLGERDTAAASAIFSKSLIAATVYGAVMLSLGLIFETTLFEALGASPDLFPLMSEYYRIVLPFMIAQMLSVVLYFFIKLDGHPLLTAMALVAGSLLNIALDYWFIVVNNWGLYGAGLATGLSQFASLAIYGGYFFSKKRTLHFSLRQSRWLEVFQAAYNGLSEFINNISAGILAAIFNWMLIQRAGVDGVAAITVVNYLLMIGYMAFFAIGDSCQVMTSQNYGAKNARRMNKFLRLAGWLALSLSLIFITVLLSQNEALILLFVDDNDSEKTIALAQVFVTYLWPTFIFVGINIILSSYLTAIHLAFQSGVVALLRSLVLPVVLLLAFYPLFDDFRFILALPTAEALTFFLAAAYFIRYRPKRMVG
ncbi:MATE family efflux transporter [Oceanicoccus sagamiensis]|uniref:MATE family efflux transporter n=1 Tax=Oceanicoccus sagamiensis TaxID=716816 RepID=UPI0023E38106|nr:MATE family efflux transporter [Oceanicoccus sagamiensis]